MPDLLVTGAAGFLGSEIVRQAAGAGLSVRATDREEPRFPPPVECIQADILETAGLRNALAGSAAVIHAAGLAHCFGRRSPAPDLFRRVNEIGTANVARAAVDAGVRHLVVISSVSVYGRSPADGANETTECHPQGPYAESKLNAERRAREIVSQTGVRLTILRLATLYGEGDPGNIGRLMRLVDRGLFVWIGHGQNRKSLLHREDAARACLLAPGMPPAAEVIYDVSAPPHRVSEVVCVLARLLDRRLPRWRVPVSIVLPLASLTAFPSGKYGGPGGLGETLRKWLSDEIYPGARFEQATGFRAQVGLEEGLRREVAWYRGLDRAKSYVTWRGRE